MMKRSSFSSKTRQSLSDITNTQSQEELNNLHDIGSEQSDHVNRIIKENVALVKLLEERDKTIELSRYELRNLREGIQNLKVQNWSLAQTNTQFLAEINLARNRVKALQHEITCKNALLKAKCCEQEVWFQTHIQERLENTQSRDVLTSENELRSTEEESDKPFVPNNRRRFIRSKSLGASGVHKTDAEKENSNRKRRQLRRKSTRVRRSVEQEDTENLFEIEDLDLAMPNDVSQQENSRIGSNTRKKKEEDLQRRDVFTRYREYIVMGQSPVDRPVRRAADKIHSYKEISLNTKMRRS